MTQNPQAEPPGGPYKALVDEIERLRPQLSSLEDVVAITVQDDGVFIQAQLYTCEGRYRPWHWGYLLKIAATESRDLTLENVVQTMHLTVALTERAFVKSAVATPEQARLTLREVRRAHRDLYRSLRQLLEMLVRAKIVTKKDRFLTVKRGSWNKAVTKRLQQLLSQAAFTYDPTDHSYKLSLAEVLWFMVYDNIDDNRQTDLTTFLEGD
ncbi:MAG: hypothetical protein ACE5OZ_11895 [Candidatus Heimdallarchaeota archaeon]